MIKPGRYRHYKGGIYIVLCTAFHSDDEKPYVLYMNEAHGTYYIKSLEEFTANIVIDSMDNTVEPRFTLLDNK